MIDNNHHVEELNCLLTENEEIQTDIVQLRLRLACHPHNRAASNGQDQSASNGTKNGHAAPTSTSPSFSLAGSFHTHLDVVSGICTDEGIVVTCSWDGSLRSFDIVEWKEFGQHAQLAPGCAILAVDMSSLDGDLVACACQDARVRVWNRRTGMLRELFGHEDVVSSVDFHHRLDVLCSGSDDARAIIWDAAQTTQVCQLPPHLSAITRVQFLGSNVYDHCLATACTDRLCRLWDIRQQAQIRALPVPGSRCTTFTPHSTDHILAAGTDLGDVLAWDLRTFTVIECFDFTQAAAGFKQGVTSIAFSPSCDYMAVGSVGGDIVVADLKQQVWETLPRHKEKVSGLAWGDRWPYGPGHTAPPYLLSASHEPCWSCYFSF